MTTQHPHPRPCLRLLPAICAVLVLLIPVALRAQITLTSTQLQLPTGDLAQPSGIAVDAAGDVFVSDTGNQRILMLPVLGDSYAQPLVLASGLGAPGALALDTAGNLFFADTLNNTVSMLPFNNSGYGLPTVLVSGLNTPTGLAIDMFDSLFVSDSSTGKILYFPNSPSGYGAPTAVVSNLKSPQGLFVDGNRNLYFTDPITNFIQRSPWTGIGYGPVQKITAVKSPSAVTLDASQNLYAISATTHTLTYCWWSAGPKRYDYCTPLSLAFDAPAALVLDQSGNPYISDPAANQAILLSTGNLAFPNTDTGSSNSNFSFNLKITAGTTIGAVTVNSPIASIPEFAIEPQTTCSAGNYAVASTCFLSFTFSPAAPGLRVGTVQVTDPTGTPLITLFLSGIGNGALPFFTDAAKSYFGTGLASPSGVATDNAGNLFISDTGNNRVVEIPFQNGLYQPQQTLPLTGIVEPMGLRIDPSGTMYLTSSGNDSVVQIPNVTQGNLIQNRLNAGYIGPSDLALDRWGDLYAASTYAQRVIRSHWNGKYFDKLSETYIGFTVGVAVDANDSLYSVSPYSSYFLRIPDSLSLTIPLILYAQQLNQRVSPAAIATDGFGNVFLLDSTSNRLLLLPATAGGYGSPIVLDSDLNAPASLALDPLGNIYIADTGNNRIVKIMPSIPNSLAFQPTFLNQTSTDSPDPIALVNLGNQPLTLTSLNFPPDFPQQPAAGACASSTVLAPGNSCGLAPAFVPTQPGSPLQEFLTLTESGPGLLATSQTISLSGNTLAQSTQSITVQPIPNLQYGTSPVAISASASSGLPVKVFVLSGPGVTSAHGTQLIVTGAGLITLQATQSGSAVYSAAATVIFTVTVAPAQLTVTASNISLPYGTQPANLPFTITGYVNNDATNRPYTGTPLIATTALRNSPVGSYPISASAGSLASTKYTFNFVPATLSITPASLTIAAQPSTTTYGHIAPPFKYTITGLIPGDSPSVLGGTPFVATLATPASPVGTYPILIFGGALSSTNYNITLVQSTLTITPSVLTVTPTSLSVTYGQPLPALTCTISGFMNSEVAQGSITGTPILTTTALTQSTPGTYPIQASLGSLAASNYTFALQPGTLTILKAPLSVIANPATMVYGTAVPALSYSISGFVFSDTTSTVTGAPQLRTTASNYSPTGSYPLTATLGSLASANYTFTFATASLTITPALLLVSANPASSTYGANPPSLSWSVTGFVNRDSRSCLSGSPSLSTTATSTSPVGTYPITSASGTLAAQNYTFVFQNGALTINPAQLIVSATNLASPYGAPTAPLTWSISGFVNGDTLSAVTGAPTLSTTALAQSSPGNYPISITPGNLTAANYTFAPQPGTYTIQKAVLTVTPNPATMVYGSVIPALTYTISGFVLNDTPANSISGAPLLHATGTGYTPVGNYIITSALGSLASANYTFAFLSAPFTVTQAQLLVSANSLSSTYGTNPPSLTYTITGFVNRESRAAIAGAPILATTATSASPTGTYPITTTLGTLSAQNYSFVLQNATISINPATLLVKGGSIQSLYGSAPPALPYQISGFVNGDTLSAISGQPTTFTTATATSPAGKYPYNLASGTLTAVNYNFTFLPGTLTIGAASILVSAQNATAVYGDTLPSPAWAFSGFLNGDTATSLTGSPNCLIKTTATPAVGNYPIICSIGTLSSLNYTFIFAPATLTITPAQLQVTAVSTSIVYGSGTAPTAATITGFVYNDTAATATTGAPRLTAILTGPVGTTPILASQGTLAAANYTLAFAPGLLTITPAPLTLTADSLTVIQGASLPTLTFTATGLVNGDTLVTAITGAPVLTTTATSTTTVGTYPINIASGTVAAANYAITLVNGTLTVNSSTKTHHTPPGILTL